MGAEARQEIQQKRQYVCEDALDDAGYILTQVDASTTGNVSKTDTTGEFPIGVNMMSTKSPITGTAAADKRVTILDSGDAWVKLTAHGNRGTAIKVGDWLQGYSDGMATYLADNLATSSNQDKAIGIALQGCGTGVNLPDSGEEPYKSGYILVKLRPRGC